MERERNRERRVKMVYWAPEWLVEELGQIAQESNTPTSILMQTVLIAGLHALKDIGFFGKDDDNTN